jgi:hypothetical protein
MVTGSHDKVDGADTVDTYASFKLRDSFLSSNQGFSVLRRLVMS